MEKALDCRRGCCRRAAGRRGGGISSAGAAVRGQICCLLLGWPGDICYLVYPPGADSLRWSGKSVDRPFPGRQAARGGLVVFAFWFTLRGPIRSDGLEKGVEGAMPGRRAARGSLVIFVFLSTLRGPILSVRAERIGRKARQREGLFTKPPFPLKSHPPKPGRPRWSYGSRARARPLAVPRRAEGENWIGCRSSFSGAAGRPGWPGGVCFLVYPPGADSFRSCGKNRKKGTSKGRAFHKAALPFEILSSEIWKAALASRHPCASPASGRAAQDTVRKIVLVPVLSRRRKHSAGKKARYAKSKHVWIIKLR